MFFGSSSRVIQMRDVWPATCPFSITIMIEKRNVIRKGARKKSFETETEQKLRALRSAKLMSPNDSIGFTELLQIWKNCREKIFNNAKHPKPWCATAAARFWCYGRLSSDPKKEFQCREEKEIEIKLPFGYIAERRYRWATK